jgi:hypothetical protein
MWHRQVASPFGNVHSLPSFGLDGPNLPMGALPRSICIGVNTHPATQHNSNPQGEAQSSQSLNHPPQKTADPHPRGVVNDVYANKGLTAIWTQCVC